MTADKGRPLRVVKDDVPKRRTKKKVPERKAATTEDIKTQTVAQDLVEIAIEHYRFGQSLEGRPFAVPLDGPNIARPIGERAAQKLIAELSNAYYERTGRVPRQAAMADARSVLLGRALGAEPEPWALRVAQPEPGLIVIDIGDEAGHAVRVTPRGWRVLKRSPVLFRRTNMTVALPLPEKGGDIAVLGDLVNLDDRTIDLVIAWLVAEFFPDIARAILFAMGESGAAKTSGTNIFARLIDPTYTNGKFSHGSEEDWNTGAASVYNIVLENVSFVPDWLSDALCRVVTGEGIGKRGLYTDDAMVASAYRRAAIINGIDVIIRKSDLGGRLLPIEFRAIDEEDRIEEEELEAMFQRAWPFLFGSLLDILAGVLKIRTAAPRRDVVSKLPRMADFARILKAVDMVRDTDALGTFLKATTDAQVDIALNHPVAIGIQKLLAPYPRGEQSWRGRASDLLAELAPPIMPRAFLPKDARTLSSDLTHLAPSLRKDGWTVEVGKKSHGKRMIRVALRGSDAW